MSFWICIAMLFLNISAVVTVSVKIMELSDFIFLIFMMAVDYENNFTSIFQIKNNFMISNQFLKTVQVFKSLNTMNLIYYI